MTFPATSVWFAACQALAWEDMAASLNAGVRIDQRDANHATALSIACRAGSMTL